MALTLLEQLALWGPPIFMLFLTGMYYLRWGKEADETSENEEPQAAIGGDH